MAKDNGKVFKVGDIVECRGKLWLVKEENEKTYTFYNAELNSIWIDKKVYVRQPYRKIRKVA